MVSFLVRLRKRVFWILLWTAIALLAYHQYWGKHLYKITAYCNCAICINDPDFHDSRFASGKWVYWGGVAADRSVPFGSSVELIPHSLEDWYAVMSLLKGRRHFDVEDRGGKIKGRHIDLFIPDKMGGHQAARQWGVRKMRIKLNGELAE